jgi:16S rRNA (adenine1518-N6/adenine1519-N6)-dimethyltransferase
MTKVHNKKLFIDVVKASFSQRRKTLINSLSNSNSLSIDKGKICTILKELGIDSNIRGESLSITQFVQLTNSIEGILGIIKK